MTSHLSQEQNRYQSIAAAFAALERAGVEAERLEVVKQEVIVSHELNPIAALVEALAVGLAAQQERIDKLEAQLSKAAKS